MKLAFAQIDAFADRPFTGNPAAVMPLEAWLDDAVLQTIAAEMALSETAFFVPETVDGVAGFRLRWLTPACEVDLCGHATLATAFVLMSQLEPARTSVRFHSRSGPLDVTRSGDVFTLDFPARVPERLDDAALAADVAKAPYEPPVSALRRFPPMRSSMPSGSVTTAVTTSVSPASSTVVFALSEMMVGARFGPVVSLWVVSDGPLVVVSSVVSVATLPPEQPL